MSPNGVFTTLMSQDEVRNALGVQRVEHMTRLLLAHYRKHWPVCKPMPFHTAPLGIAQPVFVDGEFVKSLAACDDCFPALTAARKADTAHREECTLTLKELVRMVGEE